MTHLIAPKQRLSLTAQPSIPSVQELGDAMVTYVIRELLGLWPLEGSTQCEETHWKERGGLGMVRLWDCGIGGL
jgi:hypothetical protein